VGLWQPGSVEDINKLLTKNPSIGTLTIISHGGSDGTVVVGGTNEFLKKIAAELDKRPPGSIGRIQFLGCNTGRDPTGMAALKAQLGAGAVEGTDCNLETQRLLPARRNGGQGKEILTGRTSRRASRRGSR